MKSAENSIDSVLMALEQAITNRKIQTPNAQIQPGPSVIVPQMYSELISNALRRVQEEPWEGVRKAAVYSFAAGMFLGLRHRKAPNGRNG